MIVLISGASHTGKTVLAQRLLNRYGFTYLSIDHLKMGLIRSEYTALTPENEQDELTDYLWPIVREIIKTAIENDQNLTVEGCYIPFDWQKDFDERYLCKIRAYCLIMSEDYIKENYLKILKYADIIEKRLDDSDCTMEMLISDNAKNLALCKKHDVEYIMIDSDYSVNIDL